MGNSFEHLIGLPLAGIARRLGHVLACTLDTGADVGDSVAKGLAHISGDCIDSLTYTSRGTPNNATDGVGNS